MFRREIYGIKESDKKNNQKEFQQILIKQIEKKKKKKELERQKRKVEEEKENAKIKQYYEKKQKQREKCQQ